MEASELSATQIVMITMLAIRQVMSFTYTNDDRRTYHGICVHASYSAILPWSALVNLLRMEEVLPFVAQLRKKVSMNARQEA